MIPAGQPPSDPSSSLRAVHLRDACSRSANDMPKRERAFLLFLNATIGSTSRRTWGFGGGFSTRSTTSDSI